MRLILYCRTFSVLYSKYLIMRRRQRHVRKGKRSKSIQEDHDTLDVQRQLPIRHSIYLRVIDVCRGGRWKPQDAATRVSTRAPHTGIWTSSMSPAISSTSDGNCSGLDPYAGSYICIAKLIQGIPIMASTLQPLDEASSSSSSAASPDQDSADDYPEIGGSTCWNSVEVGRLIIKVALTGAQSNNSSSRYPTIGRSEASDAQTPNNGMIWNLNPDFNVI
jgi:hypothetical protein